MAQVKDGKLEKYSPEELYENFRNIIIQAHCYGANDLPILSQVFKEAMTSLGYSQKEQKMPYDRLSVLLIIRNENLEII